MTAKKVILLSLLGGLLTNVHAAQQGSEEAYVLGLKDYQSIRKHVKEHWRSHDTMGFFNKSGQPVPYQAAFDRFMLLSAQWSPFNSQLGPDHILMMIYPYEQLMRSASLVLFEDTSRTPSQTKAAEEALQAAEVILEKAIKERDKLYPATKTRIAPAWQQAYNPLIEQLDGMGQRLNNELAAVRSLEPKSMDSLEIRLKKYYTMLGVDPTSAAQTTQPLAKALDNFERLAIEYRSITDPIDSITANYILEPLTKARRFILRLNGVTAPVWQTIHPAQEDDNALEKRLRQELNQLIQLTQLIKTATTSTSQRASRKQAYEKTTQLLGMYSRDDIGFDKPEELAAYALDNYNTLLAQYDPASPQLKDRREAIQNLAAAIRHEVTYGYDIFKDLLMPKPQKSTPPSSQTPHQIKEWQTADNNLAADRANLERLKTASPLAILGLPKKATPSEIASRYRSLLLKYHPDKNKGSQDAEEITKILTGAYKNLTEQSRYTWH